MATHNERFALSGNLGLALVTATILALGLLVVGPSEAQTIRRVSVASDGTQGNDHSTTSLYGWSSAVYGNIVAFSSFASNLVPADDNNLSDVFVRDVTGNRTELISHSFTGSVEGGSAAGTSYHPAISRNGRWVAFASLANNLVPGDTNPGSDVFLYDRATGNMIWVTAPRVPGSNGDSSFPSLATNATDTEVYVSFTSTATNLVPGDTNNVSDIFRYTYFVTTGTSDMKRVSVGAGGLQGDEASVASTISSSGRFIVYTTYIWNIIPPSPTKPIPPVLQILVYDDELGYSFFRLVTTPDAGTFPAISGDGRFFAYVQDGQIIVYDLLLFAAEQISVSSDGTPGNGRSSQPSMSMEGRFVAFTSAASNLVAGDSNGVEDVFVRDRAARQTVRVSLTSNGGEANGSSRAASISEDGRRVVFSSSATNLVSGDTNLSEDAFVTDWRPSQPSIQPDMMTRRPTDVWYLGNNVHNTTGEGQTISQAADALTPAIYYLLVQNDGSSTDSFVITGTPASATWDVHYYDALVGGTEITAAVTGGGWMVGPMDPGATREFRVEVAPRPALPPQTPYTVLVSATSVSEVTRVDTVKTVTTDLAARPSRPDMLVRNLSDTSYTGNDVYNATGENQSVSQALATPGPAVYLFQIQNDANVTDSFRITGTGGGGDWRVTYYDAPVGGSDVTAAITGPGWVVGPLAPGGMREFRAEVVVEPGAQTPPPNQLFVTGTSLADTSKLDTVLATTTKAVLPQPDLLIRNQADDLFTGNDVLNSTGAGQTVSQTANQEEPAVYVLRVQNDGNLPDSFTITGTGSQNGWVVNYYDAPTFGSNVTSLVTGSGWTIGPLAPGTFRDFRVEVAIEPGVPPTVPNETRVTATSATTITRLDTVKAITIFTPLNRARPDMMIRNQSDSSFVGNDIYNTTGADQTVSQRPTWDGQEEVATYIVRLQNDRGSNDSFVVTGTGSSGGWTVRYFDDINNNDITALVTGTGFQVNDLLPGAYRDIRVRVSVEGPGTPAGPHELRVTGTSPSDPTKTDTVCALTTKSPSQPDCLIRNASDTLYLGDNIYNTNGTDQTVAQDTTWDGTDEVATYQLRVENDGQVTDSFRVTGTGGGNGWRVIYDAGGNDITAHVTGGGWVIGFLAPGGSQSIRARVLLETPGVPPLGTHTLTLSAVSATDSTRADTVRAITTKRPCQPDGLIRRASDSVYQGDNIYNTSGTDQTVAQSTRWDGTNETAVYQIRVVNDSNLTDSFVISGNGGGSGWTVAYESGGNDITALITGPGWRVPFLGPGAFRDITVRVSLAQPNTPPSGPHQLTVTASSITSGNFTDTVRAITSKLACQPDLLVREFQDTVYVGNDIYNTTGLNQTVARTTQWDGTREAATYTVKLQNDGAATDSFVITGTGGGAGWEVTYEDRANGNDVTPQVTGSGLNTGPLAAGQAMELRVTVKLLQPGVPPQGPHQLLVTARSATDPSVADAVGATTSKLACQPDVLIKTASDQWFVGDNVYGTTGQDESAAQTTDGQTPAVYNLAVENDGVVDDSFILSGPAAGSGWTVHYVDEQYGTDVTPLVTGSGWNLGPLAPAHRRQLRVIVALEAPDVQPPAPSELLVLVRSATDPSLVDAVRVTTTKSTVGSQPDMAIKAAGPELYVGSGIINNTGDGQTVAQSAAWAAPAVYELRVENTGPVADSFLITGSGGGNGWRVTYYSALSGGDDITAQVTGSQWDTGSLGPGSSRTIRVEVGLEPGMLPQAPLELLVKARSPGDSSRSDTVRAITSRSLLPVQPDMLVRNLHESWYVGNDMYNNTGESQTATQSARWDQPATYALKAQNDGAQADALVITGTGSGAGWIATYYDQLSGGTDITAQVTGGGWTTPTLAGGTAREFRVEVALEPGVPPPAPRELLVTARSSADPTRSDTVRTITHKSALASQPDMLIRSTSDAAYTGNDIYTANGENQSVAQSATYAAAAQYVLKLQNDGGAMDSFVVTGSAGGAGWTVTYFDRATGGQDITAAITGAGWNSPPLSPGTSLELRAEVAPEPGVPPQAPHVLLVTSKSSADTSNVDTVRAVTTRSTQSAEPDLLIRAQPDTWYIGNDIVNTTGEGQTATQTASSAGAAVYPLKLQNDGPVSGSFVVTGGGGGGGWRVTYYSDLPSGTDITSQVVGAGWTVGPLAPGESREFQVQVALDGGVSGQQPHNLQVTVRSTAEANKVDVVRAVTARSSQSSQPDLMIRNMGDSWYIGDGLYNSTGESQSTTQTARMDAAAVYAVKLQNEGTLATSYLLTGSPGGNGWQVTYFSSLTGSGDITAEVTGSGYTLNAVPAGGVVELRVEVALEAGVTPPGPHQLMIRARSLSDSTKLDTVAAVTTRTTLVARPDLLLRKAGDALYAGNDVYNTTGDGQSAAGVARWATPAVYQVKVQNDGLITDSFVVTGSGSGAGWRVTYYDQLESGRSVTHDVTGAGWRIDPLAAGEFVEFRVEVSLEPGNPPPAPHELSVRVKSLADTSRTDAVRAVTTRSTQAARADMQIRRLSDAWYVGADVYSPTGQGQSVAQAAGLSRPAVFVLKVRNAGTGPDTFLVTGAAGGEHWSLKYYSALTGGTDITAQVTGAGWQTGVIEAGSAVEIRAEAAPDAGVAPTGPALQALISGKALNDPGEPDAVQLIANPPQPRSYTREFPAGLSLMGVPADPLTPRADQVLGTTQAAIWQADRQSYRLFSEGAFDLTPGLGCWVRYNSPHTVSFQGYAPETTVVRDLQRDWNLLANPGETALPWRSVVATGSVQPWGWALNDQGTGYVLITPLNLLGARQEVAPWQGFWLKANEACQVSLGGGTTSLASQPDPVAWAVPLVARVGRAVDACNYIGVARTKDPVTAENPPVLGPGHVDLYLVGTAQERNALALVGAGQVTRWDVVVETDIPGQTVQVSYPDCSAVPRDLALTLEDLETGRSVNMRTTTAYTFAAGERGATRRLRITAEPRGGRVVITNAAVQSTASGVRVAYALSAAAEVSIEVLNIGGRTVARIPVGWQRAGAHAAHWTGTDLNGRPAPAGQYLITVRCTTEDGTQAKRVIPVRLR